MKWGIVCKPQARKAISLAKEMYDFLGEHREVFTKDPFA